TTTHDSYITERGQPYDNATTFLLDSDVDPYQFSTDDFADVTYSGLPGTLEIVDIKKTFPGHFVPDCLKPMLGSRGGAFKIRSTGGAAGDVAYSVAITAK